MTNHLQQPAPMIPRLRSLCILAAASHPDTSRAIHRLPAELIQAVFTVTYLSHRESMRILPVIEDVWTGHSLSQRDMKLIGYYSIVPPMASIEGVLYTAAHILGISLETAGFVADYDNLPSQYSLYYTQPMIDAANSQRGVVEDGSIVLSKCYKRGYAIVVTCERLYYYPKLTFHNNMISGRAAYILARAFGCVVYERLVHAVDVIRSGYRAAFSLQICRTTLHGPERTHINLRCRRDAYALGLESRTCVSSAYGYEVGTLSGTRGWIPVEDICRCTCAENNSGLVHNAFPPYTLGPDGC